MKKLFSFVAVLCVGAAGLTPSDAFGGAGAVGSNCHVYNYQSTTPPSHQRFTSSLAHGLYDPGAQRLGVTCPLPMENTLGNNVGFFISVFDNSTTDRVTCYGVVYNQHGSTIATTAALNSSTSGTGNLTMSGSVAVYPQVNSYTYAVNCTLPANQSAIRAVRVY